MRAHRRGKLHTCTVYECRLFAIPNGRINDSVTARSDGGGIGVFKRRLRRSGSHVYLEPLVYQIKVNGPPHEADTLRKNEAAL